VEREPILKPAAYALLLNIAVQLILEQVWGVEITDLVRFLISISIILGAVAYAHTPFLQKLKPLLYALAYLFGVINLGVDLIFHSIKVFLQFLARSLTTANPEETE
jgi:tellurite resistance protein TerC